MLDNHPGFSVSYFCEIYSALMEVQKHASRADTITTCWKLSFDFT